MSLWKFPIRSCVPSQRLVRVRGVLHLLVCIRVVRNFALRVRGVLRPLVRIRVVRDFALQLMPRMSMSDMSVN